jgi:hypothetical protein
MDNLLRLDFFEGQFVLRDSFNMLGPSELCELHASLSPFFDNMSLLTSEL